MVSDDADAAQRSRDAAGSLHGPPARDRGRSAISSAASSIPRASGNRQSAPGGQPRRSAKGGVGQRSTGGTGIPRSTGDGDNAGNCHSRGNAGVDSISGPAKSTSANAKSDQHKVPQPVPDQFYGSIETALGLELPPEVRQLYREPPAGCDDLLYRPDLEVQDRMSLTAAVTALATSAHPVPPNLLPLAPVDDRSLAVVICQPKLVTGADAGLGAGAVPGVGLVLRWHLDDIDATYQAAVLDVDAVQYLTSVLAEINARKAGLDRMTTVAAEYHLKYVKPRVRPKSYVERPVQLACQNVVIGLASMRHESSFDGLNVPLWQTCEVPHVAAHEGARALVALMLCDAYQCGGTMEVRFQGHPESGKVPAALRRYARVLGLDAGARDPRLLTPSESRELFLAVTPMAPELARRADEAFAAGTLSPERLCFSLMSALWRDVEVDFMLAVSPRAGDVLAGGSDATDRSARSAETELTRAALMVGILRARLETVDAAGQSGQVRVFEDTRRGTWWSVLPQAAGVHLTGATGVVPWLATGALELDQHGLVVLPRPNPSAEDVALAASLGAQTPAPVCLLVPQNCRVPNSPVPVLHCPDSIDDLDSAIESKLLTARVSRA